MEASNCPGYVQFSVCIPCQLHSGLRLDRQYSSSNSIVLVPVQKLADEHQASAGPGPSLDQLLAGDFLDSDVTRE